MKKFNIKTFDIDEFQFTGEAKKNAEKIISTPSSSHHDYKFELEDLIKIKFADAEPTVEQINDFVANEIDYITEYLLPDDDLGRDDNYTPIREDYRNEN